MFASLKNSINITYFCLNKSLCPDFLTNGIDKGGNRKSSTSPNPHFSNSRHSLPIMLYADITSD